MEKWLLVSIEPDEATPLQAWSSRRTPTARRAFWPYALVSELGLKDLSATACCGNLMSKAVLSEIERQVHFTGTASRSQQKGSPMSVLGDQDRSQIKVITWNNTSTLHLPSTVKLHGGQTISRLTPKQGRGLHQAADKQDQRAHHLHCRHRLLQQHDLQCLIKGRRLRRAWHSRRGWITVT